MLSGDHFFVARERGLLKKFNLYQPSRLELDLSKAFVLSQPTNNTREYPDHFFLQIILFYQEEKCSLCF